MTEEHGSNVGHTVVLASGNQGKLRELQDALAPAGLALRCQSDLSVPEAVEDGVTFIENALIKARNAAKHTGLPAIADDSGLVVPALGGAPGIHSSRYAGIQGPDKDTANNAKLLRTMAGLEGEQRAAWFMCVLVYVTSAEDPAPVIAEGRWYGQIAHELRGEGGFGYDPLFVVDGLSMDGRVITAAELTLEQKRMFSHRGQAVARLREQLGA